MICEGDPEFDVLLPCSNGSVMCTVHRVKPTPGGMPTILFLHGFLSNRNEVPVANTGSGMFAELAKKFGNAGISSVRIDFRGSGLSKGLDFGQGTPTSMVHDVITTISAPPLQDVFERGIVLFGWCQGALVAIHTAMLTERNISGLVLLNPFFNPLDTLRKVYGSSVDAALMMSANETVEITMASGKKRKVVASFFQEMVTLGDITDLAKIHRPLQIIHGLNDNVLPRQTNLQEILKSGRSRFSRYVELETDHAFGVFSQENQLREVASNALLFIRECCIVQSLETSDHQPN